MKSNQDTIFSTWLNALNALKEILSMLNIIFVLRRVASIPSGHTVKRDPDCKSFHVLGFFAQL
jgi:hypothetical protein